MKHLFANTVAQTLALTATLIFASPAFAGEQPSTVVELFTSQGCSSCPPANDFVASLSGDTDKLVLSYGVTYWDYLGWKDSFGDPKFTKRQRSYGKALGATNIYTPQIILNGKSHGSRYTRKQVEATTLSEAQPLATLSVEEGGLTLSSDAAPNAKVVLVRYVPGEQNVDVKHGENHGRTLGLANVVTDVMPLEWEGETLATNIAADEGVAYAALFHCPDTAKILAAATYNP